VQVSPMIMRIIQQTEVYLCESRAKLVHDLEEYGSGRRTTGVIRNGSHHDDTQNRINELKFHLAETNKLIATYQEYKDA
jgi:hypothetical protein